LEAAPCVARSAALPRVPGRTQRSPRRTSVSPSWRSGSEHGVRRHGRALTYRGDRVSSSRSKNNR
jgi:hypothetical protein